LIINNIRNKIKIYSEKGEDKRNKLVMVLSEKCIEAIGVELYHKKNSIEVGK
jgi:hypothetical protein